MSKDKTVKVINDHGPLGYIFFVAWVGALIYFVQHSEGFSGFIMAIIKACVWPGILLHKILSLLGV